MSDCTKCQHPADSEKSDKTEIICDTCHHVNLIDLDLVDNIMDISCEECGENVFEFRM